MRLLKPSWVHHDGSPIFAIDIHPDGSRFATGGQGEDSGKVAIWNMGPVRDENEEKNESIPKLLCQMNNHLSCVNCVRWSNNGKSLASAGDDKLVMIWQISRYSSGGSSVFGSGTHNVEQWRPASTLRGHSGDILDLAWSGNDAWLATCSVDNTIIVWNADKFPEQVVVLKGHKGMVKGLTWDPVGSYLASQSDDKSVRVWRTRDWKEEACITEPFEECGGTTHVLRLNWSPDGHYIVSAHAMNNSGPVAQIIEREGWKSSLDFVGHRKAVTVVRFNPNIFSKKVKGNEKQMQKYTCCAIGSRDRSLSIWLTSLKRPLVVTHDLFTNSILDISWNQNGKELLACSCDGTVAYVDFLPDEIGKALSQTEMEMLLETIYGRCLVAKNAGSAGNQIIESTALLKLQQQKQQQEPTDKDPSPKKETPEKLDISANSHSSLLSVAPGTPFKPTDKQIETKTADGRRRITPIFLAPQPDVNGSVIPAPFTSNTPSSSNNIRFTTSKDPSKIVIEKQNIITKPGLASPNSRSSLASSLSSPPAGSVPTVTGGDATPKASQGEKLSDMSKPSPKPVNATIQPLSALQKKPEKEKNKSPVNTPESRPEKDRIKEKLKLAAGIKRKHDGRGRPRKVDKEKASASASATPSTTVTPVTTPAVQPHVERDVTRYVTSGSELQLPVPAFEKSFNRFIHGKHGTEKSLLLEVVNDMTLGTQKIHQLQLVKDGVKVWEHVLSSRIVSVDGSRDIICVGCEDGVVNVYSFCGRKIIPNLALNSKIYKVCTNGHFAMAITQKGSIYLWNMQTMVAVMKNESLTSIISGNDSLLRATVTQDGLPLLTLTNNKSYTFSVALGCWTLLYNKSDPIQHCSDHHSSTPSTSSSLKNQGPLASLQSLHDRLGQHAGRMLSAGHSLQQTATLSHLETQLASCISLKSASEYKYWLLTYVRYVVKQGLEVKLREVCDDLLGPVYKSKKAKTSWESSILGLEKRSLLEDILPLIGENLHLQRLFTEYHDQLESIVER